MKNILSLIVILIFLSCNNKKTKILIENNTNSTIDTFKLTYGTEKESKKYLINNINPKKRIEVVFDMNFEGIDGGYFFELYQKEKDREIKQDFGYYSNAVFKNYTFTIKIENDTILINKDVFN